MRKILNSLSFKMILLMVLIAMLVWSIVAVRVVKLKEPSEYEKLMLDRESAQTTQSSQAE